MNKIVIRIFNKSNFEYIKLEETTQKMNYGPITFFKTIRFNFKESSGKIKKIIIKNFYNSRNYNYFITKIKKKRFSIRDYEKLIGISNEFNDKLGLFFSKLSNRKLEGLFDKLKNTIDINYSPFGHELFNKRGIYWYISEFFYNNYLNCLNLLDDFTKFDVLKPVPRHMLGLIYANTGRHIRMLPNLGMTLLEDRKVKHHGSADRLLDIMRSFEAAFLEKQYQEVKKDFSSYHYLIQFLPDHILDLIMVLEKKMDNFPEHSFLYLTQKYEFTVRYLLNSHPETDIFTSFLRLELLMVFTAFVETLLRKILDLSIPKKNQTVGVLIKKFYSIILRSGDINLFDYRTLIPVYSKIFSIINEEESKFYTDFCNFIFRLCPKLKTNIIDISSIEKLRIYQASVLLQKTRNQFHHDLFISTEEIQISIRKDIPKIFEYLSDVKKFNKIFTLFRYYLCLVLIFAYIKSKFKNVKFL